MLRTTQFVYNTPEGCGDSGCYCMKIKNRRYKKYCLEIREVTRTGGRASLIPIEPKSRFVMGEWGQ